MFDFTIRHEKNENIFLIFEKFLRDFEKAENSQHVISNVNHENEKIDNFVKHFISIDCNNFFIVETKKTKTNAKKSTIATIFISTTIISQLQNKTKNRILSIFY